MLLTMFCRRSVLVLAASGVFLPTSQNHVVRVTLPPRPTATSTAVG